MTAAKSRLPTPCQAAHAFLRKPSNGQPPTWPRSILDAYNQAARRAGIYVTMAAWQTRLRINAWPADPKIYT
jgi:hypothetical protein